MRAVIPAAGMGKRLRPYTIDVPKVMISLAGKPLIGHILDNIAGSGVTSVSLIVGYKGEQVVDYVNENYSHLRLDFPYQAERKGLGHAVLQGLEDKEEEVLILLGDTIFDVDYQRFIACESSAIGVVQVEDPSRFGVVEVDTNNMATLLIEKPEHPKSNLALAGLYYIKDQRLLLAAIQKLIDENITTRGEYQLTDALQILIENGEEIQAIEIKGWYDCGTKESLLASQRFILKHSVSRENEATCIIHPPVFIHPEAQVSHSTLGPNVTIDKGARISGSRIEESIIGKEATVKNIRLSNALLADRSVTEGDEKQVISESQN